MERVRILPFSRTVPKAREPACPAAALEVCAKIDGTTKAVAKVGLDGKRVPGPMIGAS